MDESFSGSDTDDQEDWKSQIFDTKIAFHWLSYNPDAFSPKDEYFYRTGNVPKINLTDKFPPPSWSPIFIIGCGRSGTTIISKILSGHSEVCFLNEPRSLWIQSFPNFDVWSAKSSGRGGQLEFPITSIIQDSSNISNILYSVAHETGKSVLIEKTPENTFRLDWLNSLFPNSKFIMVKRNPIQTARSIARFQPDTWFGFDEYKWKELKKVYERYNDVMDVRGEFWKLAEKNVFAKALVEWTLSTLSAEGFKLKLSEPERSERFFELHLESLMRDTGNVIRSMLEFIGLKDEDGVHLLAEQLLRREMTLTAGLSKDICNDGTTEEELLSLAGSDVRNLIFHHSFHI